MYSTTLISCHIWPLFWLTLRCGPGNNHLICSKDQRPHNIIRGRFNVSMFCAGNSTAPPVSSTAFWLREFLLRTTRRSWKKMNAYHDRDNEECFRQPLMFPVLWYGDLFAVGNLFYVQRYIRLIYRNLYKFNRISGQALPEFRLELFGSMLKLFTISSKYFYYYITWLTNGSYE